MKKRLVRDKLARHKDFVDVAKGTHSHSVHSQEEQRRNQQEILDILQRNGGWMEGDLIDKASGWQLGSHILHCAIPVLLAQGKIESRNDYEYLNDDGSPKLLYSHIEMVEISREAPEYRYSP